MVATNFFMKRQIPCPPRDLGTFHFFIFPLKGTDFTSIRFDIIKNEILYLIVGKTATQHKRR